VIRFTGKGWNDLIFDSRLFGDDDSQSQALTELLQTIQLSVSSLKILDITARDSYLQIRPVLDLVANCEIIQLKLLIKGASSVENQVYNFPQNTLPSHIVNLTLKLIILELDWESEPFLGWSGTKLETFQSICGEKGPYPKSSQNP